MIGAALVRGAATIKASVLAVLAATGGAALVGFLPSGVGAVPQSVEAVLQGSWGTPEQYGAVGDGVTDDTTAINRCLTARGACYLVPGRTYVCDAVALPANACIFSVGRYGVLKQKAAPAGGSVGMLYANSGAAGATLDNISIFGATLLGQVAAQGFSQFVHLVSVNGVRNFTMENCLVKGFRGDGLYVGSGINAGDERHNFNVRVVNCDFDGVNNDNRNGVSVLDVDGLLISACTFRNCTRPSMPGPVDLEPDGNAFHILRNVRVEGNQFVDCGGNYALIGVLLPAVVTNTARSIHILRNKSTNYTGTGAFVTFNTSRAPTAASEENDLQIVGNYAKTGPLPLQLFDGKRVVLRDNTFIDFTSGTLLGYNGATNKMRDVEMNDTYIRCGSGSGNGVSIFSVDHLKLGGKLVDCGTGVPGSANAIDFNTGTSSYVDIERLEVSSPTGKTLIAIQKEAGHTFSASTNRFVNNNVGTLTNAFQAEYSDELETSYAPVVSGAGSAGAGTYSRQYGRYQRIGKRVFVTAEVIVNAGHTGTGMVQISLPVNVKAASNNELRALALSVDGAATTGGQIGQINPAAVVGGVTGAVRCYHTATGALQQTTVPAGAFTVRFNGSYEAE